MNIIIVINLLKMWQMHNSGKPQIVKIASSWVVLGNRKQQHVTIGVMNGNIRVTHMNVQENVQMRTVNGVTLKNHVLGNQIVNINLLLGMMNILIQTNLIAGVAKNVQTVKKLMKL